MNLIEIFSIIFIHWFADFVLQTHKQATGKSKNLSDLLGHTITYTLSFGIIALFLAVFYILVTKNKILVNDSILWFLPITFICHTITDYFTSRLNSRLLPKREYLTSHPHLSHYFVFKDEKYHNFFVSIGFDQLLHYIQLFTTYWLLTKK